MMVQIGRQNVNTADDIVPSFPQEEGQGPHNGLKGVTLFLPVRRREGYTGKSKK